MINVAKNVSACIRANFVYQSRPIKLSIIKLAKKINKGLSLSHSDFPINFVFATSFAVYPIIFL